MWWSRVSCDEEEEPTFIQQPDDRTDARQGEETVIVKNTFIDFHDKSDVRHVLRRSASDSELSMYTTKSSHSHGVSEASGLDPGEVNFVYAQSISSAVSIKPTEWISAGAEPCTLVLNNQLRQSGVVDSHGLVSNATRQSGGAVCEDGDPELWSLSKDLKISIAEIQDFGDIELLKSIPRIKTGELTSVGSLQHAEGNCNPCLFWYRNSCTKGIKCDFCHMKHKGQKSKRIRPGKKVRQLMRSKLEGAGSEAAEVQVGFESDDDSCYDALESSIRSKSEAGSSCGSSEVKSDKLSSSSKVRTPLNSHASSFVPKGLVGITNFWISLPP